ncbi:hypothetical protein DFH11DRAFT_1634015 [Phellopilus nigrolimitatus]|nr:hypothetical protein DFH11DRAFT_1634015 [Phellopilus nigrolimitatus]
MRAGDRRLGADRGHPGHRSQCPYIATVCLFSSSRRLFHASFQRSASERAATRGTNTRRKASGMPARDAWLMVLPNGAAMPFVHAFDSSARRRPGGEHREPRLLLRAVRAAPLQAARRGRARALPGIWPTVFFGLFLGYSRAGAQDAAGCPTAEPASLHCSVRPYHPLLSTAQIRTRLGAEHTHALPSAPQAAGNFAADANEVLKSSFVDDAGAQLPSFLSPKLHAARLAGTLFFLFIAFPFSFNGYLRFMFLNVVLQSYR